MPATAPLTRREVVCAVALGIALALALHWPLPLKLGTNIAQDLGDPLVQAWQVAWDGHALVHQPTSLFQSNTFWPLRDSLAFSDALVGYAPAGLIGSGVHAAVARYDVLFLFAYALCFVGAWLLARELGVNRLGAAVAGAAYAYAPWRLEQEGHMHIISSGGIPLTLFLLVRGYGRGSPRTIVAGWLVAAWQLSLGFSLGLPFVYVLGALAIAVAVVWWRKQRLRPTRQVLLATATGILCFALVAVLLVRPYLRVQHDHPEAKRSITTVAVYSGPLKEFAAASASSRVWGAAAAPVRDSLAVVPEQTLFPGLAILVLAIAGLRAAVLPRRLRRGLAAAALAFAVLSLGFELGAGSFLYPYRWLYETLPGWEGIRVPGRMHTFTTLCLALLAAAGAQAVAARAQRRWGTAAATACAAALTLAVLAEGWGFADHPRVPLPPAGERAAPAPALHLPTSAFDNRRYVLWSTDGFPKIVNGRSSIIPPQFAAVMRAGEHFPDAASVALYRRIGIRSVVVHTARTRGTALADASTRSLRGLHLKRERRRGVVIFLLR